MTVWYGMNFVDFTGKQASVDRCTSEILAWVAGGCTCELVMIEQHSTVCAYVKIQNTPPHQYPSTSNDPRSPRYRPGRKITYSSENFSLFDCF